MTAALDLPRGFRNKRGVWWDAPRRDRPIWKAGWSCPVCGTPSTLREHRIGADGGVSPKVQCVLPSCGWTHAIRLDGWDGGAL